MKKLIKSYTKSKVAIALSTAILLNACGGTDQDTGVVSLTEQVFSGQAIDGYVARATVFIDTNNDGTRNAWEPFAFTDNSGYYSYNPFTDTNYCADTATPEQAQYCLKTSVLLTNTVIRIDGGYDVTTGEPFIGQISRRIQNISETGESDTIISPISSLLTNVQTEQEETTLLTSLGLNSSDLDINYFNVDGNGEIDSTLLNKALKVHKVVAVLSDRLTDTYDEIGEELGTPNDASSEVYSHLAEQLIDTSLEFNTLIESDTDLITILNNAESAIQDIYVRKDINLPADIGSLSNPGNFSRAVDVATSILNVVDSLIDPNTAISESEALGSVRALESVVIKSLEETNTDVTFDNAVSFLTEGDTTLVDSLLTSLSLDTADVVLLAQNDFSGSDFNSIEGVSQAGSLAAGTEPFTQLGGSTLKVSDLDLGQSPNRLEDKEVEFYFNGTAEDLEGSFSACVKYIDDASSDGTLGEGNTRGELINGFWSLLGAESSNIESYSALLTITFLGATYQGILKPGGEETISDEVYNKVRFDFDGELVTYHSEEGVISTTSIPTSNAECLQRLPSRIGI
jgi:hypothetical protein